MKYKLLKDTPTHKAGAIFIELDNGRYTEEIYEVDQLNYSKEQISNPEWFEPVEEFKKEFEVTAFAYADDSFWLHEKIGTEEQAKAKKELMVHIYKFEEPKESRSDNCFYLDPDLDWCEENTNTMSRASIDYHLGLVITNNTDKQDREERILLLNNYINSLKS